MQPTACAGRPGRRAGHPSNHGPGPSRLYFLAVLKVAVLPGLVFISCRYGFGLDPFSVKIAVLMAALPVAVNVFILASRYQSYETQVSSAMLLSAGMGLLVISGLLLILA